MSTSPSASRVRLTALQRNTVAAQQRWRCSTCGDLLPAYFHVDHTIPLHLGGSPDWRTNTNAKCVDCHARKTHQEMLNWIEQSSVYEVKAITAERRVGNRVLYRVAWEGYPGEDTWEPIEHLENCSHALHAWFQNKQ